MHSYLTAAKTPLIINQSLSTPSFIPPKIHWDNACSYNITNSPQLFQKLIPLTSPIPIGGIGGRCLATHAGYLKCLPSHNYINFALFSPDSPQTLLSLGQLHSCGGGYTTTVKPHSIAIYADSTALLDTTPLLLNSNLYTANVLQIITAMQTNPHLLQPPHHTPPSCTQFTASIRKFIQQHPPAKSTIKTAYIKAFLNEASLPTRSSLRSLTTKPDLHPDLFLSQQNSHSTKPHHRPSKNCLSSSNIHRAIPSHPCSQFASLFNSTHS